MENETKYDDFTQELDVLVEHLSKYPDVLNSVRQKIYDIKETTQTYRTINSWESSELLDDERLIKGKGWRKFSMADVAWILIISKLRDFGFPIDKIKQTKKSLLSPIKIPGADFTVIEWICIRITSLQDAGNTYLLVDINGVAEVMTPAKFNANNFIGNIPVAYIYINLNQLFA